MITPISQDWFDENRERFDAQTTIAPKETKECKHFLVRKSDMSVECNKCTAGWRMPIREVDIVEGKPIKRIP